MTQSIHTLMQWESFLREQVAGGDVLLGQLPIGGSPFELSDMNQLGQFLAGIFSRHPFRNALKIIETKYPLSFALYLVLQGIFNYGGGEYWSAPGIQLGIENEYFYSSNCGQTFRHILKTFHLPSFSNVGGHANLGPILAHGGIPNYSLGDFFKLLNKSMGKEKILLDAETLIERWGMDPEETFFFIDVPVQRFVLHGGDVAEDFVDRCIALFIAKDDKEFAELDLPLRVVNEFKVWKENQSVPSFSKSRIRLERPYIYMDPYEDGVCIGLPPQEFPSDIGFSQLTWQIKENENQVDIETDRQRTESGYEFIVSEIVHASVSFQYHVILKSEQGEIRDWTLEGVGDESILFFDPDTCEIIRKQVWQQPGEKWIVYPNEYELLIENGQKTSALPQQHGTWGKFTIEEWDLYAGGSLTLKSPTGETFLVHIDGNLARRRPYLDGGTKPLNQSFRSDLPLYSGQPPILVIPFGQTPDDLQLSRWRISIKPDGNAHPNSPCSYLLSELQDWIISDEDNQVFLDLTSPKLFGGKPCGKFGIEIQGPLGRGRRFRVRLIPNLTVQGHRSLYLAQNAGDAVMYLSCESDTTIECVQNEGVALECTQNKGDRKQYQTTIDAHISLGNFVYIDPRGIRVPFFIKVRRLRWGLWQRTAPKDLSWTTTVQRIFPQAIPNISETELFVDLPTLVDDAYLFAGWRLINPQGTVILERGPDTSKSRQQFTIPIGEIMPSCRQAQIDGITLNLQIWLLEKGVESKEYFVDVMHLLPTLELGTTETEWRFENSFVYVSILWESQQTSPYMKLLIWPLDQPWQNEPLIFDVSANNDGYFQWEIPISNIPSLKSYGGDILGEMLIIDPWSTEEPLRPKHQQPNTLLFHPKYAKKYYSEIEEKFRNNNASPEEALTLLSFYHRHQQLDNMHQVNILLSHYAKDYKLDFDQLILWATIVKDVEDKQAYKLVQWTLFKTKLLDKVEKEWIEHPRLSQYLAHLSDNLLEPEAYKRLLIAGYSEVRQVCLTGLCRFGNSLGFAELLKDVELGEIVLSEAASMLASCNGKAVNYLLQTGTQDAIDILYILAQTNDMEITWLQPNFQLSTDIGQIKIKKIEISENGRFIPQISCLLTDTGRVSVVTINEYESLPAILMLPERTVVFQQETIYQCTDCGNIFDKHQNAARHHDIAHPLTPKAFRQVKSREIKLKKTTVQIPNGGRFK